MIDFNKIPFLEKYKKAVGDLCYLGDGGLAAASPKQVGYIKGLCKQTGVERWELKYDLNNLTINEAKELIDELLLIKENPEFKYYRSKKQIEEEFYNENDDDELPF